MTHSPSFGLLIVNSLADQWANIRTLTIRKLVFLTFFWGAILLGLFLIVSLADVQVQARTYLALGVVLFLSLLTASWVAIALRQASLDLADESARQHVAALIAVVPTLVITALLTWSTVSLMFVALQQPLHPRATDYASCVANGGLVLQTNPAQCITTANTFTDPRGVQ